MFKGKVIGRVTADLQLLQGKKSEFVSFWAISNKGYGENETKQAVECLLFGDAAKRIINAKVRKGSLLYLYGDIELKTYEAKLKDGSIETRAKVQMLVLDWEYIPVGRKKEDSASSDTNTNKTDQGSNNDEIVYYDEDYIEDEAF